LHQNPFGLKNTESAINLDSTRSSNFYFFTTTGSISSIKVSTKEIKLLAVNLTEKSCFDIIIKSLMVRKIQKVQLILIDLAIQTQIFL